MNSQELKLAVAQYLSKARRAAIFFEVGVAPRGKLRVDVLAINFRREVIVVETKSGLADFRADKKMGKYLDYCTQMYVAADAETCEKIKDRMLPGIGLIQVKPIPEGKRKYPVKVIKKAEIRKLDSESFTMLAIRSAYKAADYTRYRRNKNVF